MRTGAQPIAQLPPNPKIYARTGHSTVNSVPYSFRSVNGFFYVPVLTIGDERDKVKDSTSIANNAVIRTKRA